MVNEPRTKGEESLLCVEEKERMISLVLMIWLIRGMYVDEIFFCWNCM